MSEFRFGRRTRTTAIVGAAALSVLLTACGGTRMSDEAIVGAAGAAQQQQVADAARDGLGAVTGGEQPGVGLAPAAPGQVATDTTAAAPGTAGQTATGTQNTGGAKDRTATTRGNQAAGGSKTAQAPGPVTRKSVIKLGAVGTFSGPVGGLVKDTVTGIRAWSQAVNAQGGINGHPVEILVGDDGGDPARFNSILQQFVEQQGVQAFLYTTLGFSPNGNNKYLDSKKIYTFAHEGGLEVPYTNPYVLTPAAAGLTYADVMVLSFGAAIGAKGGVKLASFACSDFGLCDNFDKRWSDATVLEKAGFSLVARGRPSLTQPDYTSQCLAAKQAGAEAIIVALDGAAIRRFASDCARQSYRPKLSSADLVITADVPGDKNVDGLVVGTKMAPFTDARIQGVREMLAGFARFAPGQTVTGGMSYGWLIGEFFSAAAKNLPDNQSLKDIEDGIYSIRDNNLKGLTYPITMTRGKPMARQLCYGVVLVAGDKFATGPGKSFQCAKGGKPLSNPNDYGVATGSIQQGSVQQSEQATPMRAALQASAPSATPATPAAAGGWLPYEQHPTVGVIPARPRVVTAASLVAATPSASTGSAVGSDTCPSARVAGISYLLDVLQTGSSAGPAIAYGVALAVLGTPLPEPLGQYQGQILAEAAKLVEQFSKEAPAAVQEVRAMVEPLAEYNDQPNVLIDGVADALETVAADYGTFIQPADRSLQELAAIILDARAADPSC